MYNAIMKKFKNHEVLALILWNIVYYLRLSYYKCLTHCSTSSFLTALFLWSINFMICYFPGIRYKFDTVFISLFDSNKLRKKQNILLFYNKICFLFCVVFFIPVMLIKRFEEVFLYFFTVLTFLNSFERPIFVKSFYQNFY